MLVRGADLLAGGVIYGLVDPLRPGRVRYVGQTKSEPVSRYLNHLSVRAWDKSARAEWIRELLAADRLPDMVLLERVPKLRHLTDRERCWIDDLRQRGQADLNGPLPGHWAHRRANGFAAKAAKP